MSAQEQIKKPSKKARLSAARLCAVQTLYQMAMTGVDANEALRHYRDHQAEQEIEGDVYVAADTGLLSRIVLGVEERRGDIADMIKAAFEGKTAANEPLLHAILAAGLYELLAESETDTPLIIHEYLDITHAFYDGEENRLVNGILDRLAKQLR